MWSWWTPVQSSCATVSSPLSTREFGALVSAMIMLVCGRAPLGRFLAVLFVPRCDAGREIVWDMLVC